jgi:hypothetical protein
MTGERVPDVIVDFVFENGLFHISVINIGDAPAFTVNVSFNRPLKGLGGKKVVSDMALFQNIEFMPPQKRISTFLDTAASYFKQQLPTDFITTIKFNDRDGKRYQNVMKHNINIYRDIGYVPEID